MRIGDLSGEINDDIKGFGFRIVDSFKLLGFHISNTGVHSRLNVDPIKQIIGNIIRFWDRFYLSLQGKITVYKTLLMPQLNYICTIRCITFCFFSNKKNCKSSYGSPEQNMEPKIFYIFLAASPRCAGGQKVHI